MSNFAQNCKLKTIIKMTIKEVIEESKTVLQRMNETDGTREEKIAKLHKLLGVLAVKAEYVTDTDTKELVDNIDRCRELLKQGAFDDANKVLVFVNVLSEIQNYKWEEDEDEKWEKELAEEDRLIALEDVQKAYNQYLMIRQSYIEKYGDIPTIDYGE